MSEKEKEETQEEKKEDNNFDNKEEIKEESKETNNNENKEKEEKKEKSRENSVELGNESNEGENSNEAEKESSDINNKNTQEEKSNDDSKNKENNNENNEIDNIDQFLDDDKNIEGINKENNSNSEGNKKDINNDLPAPAPAPAISNSPKNNEICKESFMVNFQNAEKVKIIKKGNENSRLNISYDFLFKVALMGDSNTGKTSILIRFVDNVFKEETAPTIGVDFKIVSMELDQYSKIKLQIWDTAGQDRFQSMTVGFIKSCSAFILVFDLSRNNTFINVKKWIDLIKENTAPKFLILIGNKSDLVEQREVSLEEIKVFCEKNSLNYMEISAKTNENVEILFKEVAYQLYSDIKKKRSMNANVDLKEFEVGGYKNIRIHQEEMKVDETKKGCC